MPVEALKRSPASEPAEGLNRGLQALAVGDLCSLGDFVQKVAAVWLGEFYFATPYTLGQYLLMDYVQLQRET